MNAPKLYPLPRQVALLGGEAIIPEQLTFSIQDSCLDQAVELLVEERDLRPCEEKGWLRFEICKELQGGDEAHRIVITASGALIQAASPAGAFRATRTMKTLLAWEVATLPCLEIRDFPAFSQRGFMLDVSRCKVPTMDTLFTLIDLLADLKYNELQLYVEHTFAFADHETVWKDASPLTAEEVQLLDERCRRRFIELVPNLNSFGHFERWLRHEPYKSLAECPGGFRREVPFIERDHGSTLAPGPESLAFVDSLYAEYLPNFSSRRFNVGMDEPWELGQGRSRKRVEQFGKQNVYLEHLDGIRKLAEKYGREMLFWADVLLEEPENASRVPPSSSPVVWGYEAEHPFEEQASTLDRCGLSYYLSPGSSTWRSFTGRLNNALANVRASVEIGLRQGATGLLLTSWGDCGNHQPWPTQFPALLFAAGLSWNENADPEKDLEQLLDTFFFPGEKETPTAALLKLGKLDLALGPKIVNSSLPWLLLFADQPEKLHQRLQADHPAENLAKARTLLADLRPGLDALASCPNSPASLAAQELLLGADLSSHALAAGQRILGASPSAPHELPPAGTLPKHYETLWLERARPGGLPESVDLLSTALQGLAGSTLV